MSLPAVRPDLRTVARSIPRCIRCSLAILPGQPAAHRDGVPYLHLACLGAGPKRRPEDDSAPVEPAPGADRLAERVAAAIAGARVRCSRCDAPAACANVAGEAHCSDCCPADADDPCWPLAAFGAEGAIDDGDDDEDQEGGF